MGPTQPDVNAFISKDELNEALWGSTDMRSNTVAVHVMRLRRNLGDDESNPQWIRGLRGVGYQLRIP